MPKYSRMTIEESNQPNCVGKLYNKTDLITIEDEGCAAELRYLESIGVVADIDDYGEGYIVYREQSLNPDNDLFHVFIY